LIARADASARAFLEERPADVVALVEHRRTRDAPTPVHGLPAAG
jgi:hypothetical protein